MKYWFIIFLMGLMAACEEPVYTPKPKAFFRIDLPAKTYQKFDPQDCPYSFEYPAYAQVNRDTSFFESKTEDPCWLNISFASLGGMIHVSYKPITPTQSLYKLSEDAHKLTFKHTVRADYIDEQYINTANGVKGVLYEVGGNSASNVQFFITDSTKHYLRGALYFNTVPNADSLESVIKFVKQDMLHLLETFRWK